MYVKTIYIITTFESIVSVAAMIMYLDVHIVDVSKNDMMCISSVSFQIY